MKREFLEIGVVLVLADYKKNQIGEFIPSSSEWKLRYCLMHKIPTLSIKTPPRMANKNWNKPVNTAADKTSNQQGPSM